MIATIVKRVWAPAPGIAPVREGTEVEVEESPNGRHYEVTLPDGARVAVGKHVFAGVAVFRRADNLGYR